ncbi:uncharacterized protein LOC135307578 isoform X2 [Passer domesticus]|uniref:uncharacterized protein LOC135307578 isoform X2 n=1 Tax=Passer domesticus TaxID=48849 RepID=UPI0030FE4C52
MRQMLKEMQQAGEEVDGEAVQKAAFPGGSSGSVPASAEGREAMPGTGTGAEVAQKASPLAWLHKVLKPLESPAGVSAGRTSPAPLLIPTKKTGSHGRGPLRRKNKGKGQKKPHEPNNILKQIVTELHKGHGMDREALWKVAFPEGREEMPGRVPGDEDHVLNYLETLVNGGLKTLPDVGANLVGESDLASQPTFRIESLGDAEVMDQKAGLKEVFPQGSSGSLAAPAAGRKAMADTGTGTADEVSGKASPLAWLHKVLVLSDPLSGVSAARTSPAPLLIPTQKPGSHRRDWDRDMDSMLVFLDESVKTSADGGANPVGESDLASQPTFRIEPLGDAEGVSAGRTFPGPLVDVARRTSSLRRDAASTRKHADNIGKSTRVFCWVTPCLKKLMAIVAGAALCLMMCYAAIWYCWKRNWSTSGQEFKDGGCTLLPDSLSCSSGLIRAWTALSPVLCREPKISHLQGNLLLPCRSHCHLLSPWVSPR